MSKFFGDTTQICLREQLKGKKCLGYYGGKCVSIENCVWKSDPKIKRIYEDTNWVIDLIDGNLRVSYFEDYHYVDEIILSGDDFKDKE